MYHPETDPPDNVDDIIRDVEALNEELRGTDAWVFAGGLHPSSSATVVRLEGRDVLTTDGPFVEGKEHVGGFKAPDLDAALGWARGRPERAGCRSRCAISKRRRRTEPRGFEVRYRACVS